METWAGINAPAGRKKDQGIGMHPMQAVCRYVRAHPYDSLRASSSSRGCKNPVLSMKSITVQKVLNLINIFIES